jgi:two-component system, response regulator
MTIATPDILLVDDDPDDVELTVHALRSNNLVNSIQVLADGQEALDFLFREGDYADRPENTEPKVILLDLKLPKIDGLEVLRTIKSDVRLQTVPVVMLTSSREERDVVESYNLGVNSYLVKPVEFDRFAEAIRMTGMYWLLLNRPPVNGGPERATP